jgi:hypothetical protein
MRTHKALLALATAVAALAGASAFDSQSAQALEPAGGSPLPTGDILSSVPLGASQPGQSPRGATSRPSNRDMRMAPMGRGMRGSVGRGRMNGGMRGRR